MRRKRILFIAEPASLAHVTRSAVLARALERDEFEVVFATDPAYRRFVDVDGARFAALDALGTRAFLARVAAGRRIYTPSRLVAYAEDDRRLLDAFEPDAVIGDFRLSLAASARAARVPYLALCNAYWDRRSGIAPDVPVHATTRMFGVAVMRALFGLTRDAWLAHHGASVAALKRRCGLPVGSRDLRDAVVDADVRLFADAPELVALASPTPRDVFVGPLLWSPPLPLPADIAAHDRPLVYVSLGSSGDPRLLPTLVHALAELPLRIVVATAGAALPSRPSNVCVVEYANGAELARRATFVVTNGGSASSYQAFAEGAPVLAVPSNMDQLLATAHFTRAGVALSLRAEHVTRARVQELSRTLLDDPRFADRARAVAASLARFDPGTRLASVLHGLNRSPAPHPDAARAPVRALVEREVTS